jgi:hypothetical protein
MNGPPKRRRPGIAAGAPHDDKKHERHTLVQGLVLVESALPDRVRLKLGSSSVLLRARELRELGAQLHQWGWALEKEETKP